MDNQNNQNFQPIQQSERIHSLDALRGLAIFGIFIINIRIFSGYAYLQQEIKNELLFSQWDPIFDWIHIVFFSGKFYTLFSLLFGIGFAIQMERAIHKKRPFVRFFSRRLFFLFLISLIHLWVIWFSDILTFYAICGFLMIIFRKVSNKTLLWISLLLMLLSALHAWYLYKNGGGYTNYLYQYLSDQWALKDLPKAPTGYDTFRMPDITEVVRSDSWETVFKFNSIGPLIRLYIISYDARLLKILAIFLIGLWSGRNMLFHKLHENKPLLKRIALIGWMIGLPINIFFVKEDLTLSEETAWIFFDNMLVFGGYIALTSAYAATFLLVYQTRWQQILVNLLSPVGKTALSNYILQSILGILIFYSAGLGIGEYTGATTLTLAVFLIFGFQIMISKLWMNHFYFGPLEWLWRSLTYGKFIKNRRNRN